MVIILANDLRQYTCWSQGQTHVNRVLQLIFFRFSVQATHVGITNMGIMIIAAIVFALPIYFPAWGGLLKGPKEDATEEEYYLADYNDAEIAAVRFDSMSICLAASELM